MLGLMERQARCTENLSAGRAWLRVCGAHRHAAIGTSRLRRTATSRPESVLKTLDFDYATVAHTVPFP